MKRNLLSKQHSKKRALGPFRSNSYNIPGSKHRRRVRNASDRFQSSMPGTILVPIDFTEASHNGLDFAILMATKLNCSVVIAHILQPSYAEGFMDVDQKKTLRANARRDTRRKLNCLARTKSNGYVSITSIVRHGLPEYEILRIAEALNVGLIILGRQHRNPLSRLIFGSVTADVVDAAACPVLVVNNSGVVPRGIGQDLFNVLRDSAITE